MTHYAEPSENPDLIDWDDRETLEEIVFSAARDYCSLLSRRGDHESAMHIRECIYHLEDMRSAK